MEYKVTSSALPKSIGGGYAQPVNVAVGGVACTINTRYESMDMFKDILTLAHFPKTVVFLEYEI